jgi:urocanate hydratase
MALDPIDSRALDFILEVERFYAGLILCDDSGDLSDSEPSLGGKLIYAGELDASGRALLVAGNIAGAASLAATANLPAQKQAIRDGVADFLVNSLDEALRILKNEIRKREPVAVCVSITPDAIEHEMLERGVLPDLLSTAKEFSEPSPFVGQGAKQLRPAELSEHSTLLKWRVGSGPAQWLPRLDAIAVDCLSDDDGAARRWLRLSPRYLGRLAHGIRILNCSPESADKFVERAHHAMDCGEIGVPVEIQATIDGFHRQHRFSPQTTSTA